ncbi:hypothetical protein [Roseicella aerolata]|uniref:Uncharacterized protein n=1 Tax=Roseicella aerolata TaxID=2883479 RepID=A0A9X1IAE7_9PROT|nr:hypothetical protein [Roseicella aerolata]MCB4821164.1 hypothetical protein [Roseicella aerolata]
MSRRCHACIHPHRAAIDGLLAAGTPAGQVAEQFGLGPDAVERHAKNHLRRALNTVRAALAPPAPAAEVIPPLPLAGLLTVHGLAQRLGALVGRAEALLEDAERDGNLVLRGGAIRELRATITDALRAATMLQPEAAAPVQVAGIDPNTLADRLLAALHDQPEARAKVAAALAELAQ